MPNRHIISISSRVAIISLEHQKLLWEKEDEPEAGLSDMVGMVCLLGQSCHLLTEQEM